MRSCADAEELIQQTSLIELHQVVTTADRLVVDKNLGQAAAAFGPAGHGLAGGIIAIDEIFVIDHPFAIEQPLSPDAVGTKSPSVNFYLGELVVALPLLVRSGLVVSIALEIALG